MFAVVVVPAEPAEYELTLDTAARRRLVADVDRDQLGLALRLRACRWGAGLLPLLQVDYELALDDVQPRRRADAIRLRPYSLADRNLGADAIASIAAWSSVDDGETWAEVDLADAGEGWSEGMIAIPASCDPSCYVSLRVETADADGNVLEQEITRAYAADYVAAPPTTTAGADHDAAPDRWW